MKAVRIHEFGGPEVLKYEDAPDPVLRKDQVLVRVRACSLNHLDLWARGGLKGITFPHILGSDVAGEVVESGEYISDIKPGTRVLLAPMMSAITAKRAWPDITTSARSLPCWAIPWTAATVN